MPTKNLTYYLGLQYPIEIRGSSENGFFATHPDLDGCMAEGATHGDAIANLGDSRELWIEARLQGGYSVPEPVNEEYSGRVSLRMPPLLHAQLVRLAERSNVSLNLLINSVLAGYAGGAEPLMDFINELKTVTTEMRQPRSSPSPPAAMRIGDQAGFLPQSPTPSHGGREVGFKRGREH